MDPNNPTCISQLYMLYKWHGSTNVKGVSHALLRNSYGSCSTGADNPHHLDASGDVMKITDHIAIQQGKESRIRGIPVLNNTYSRMAWDNMVRNLGTSSSPKREIWQAWAKLWEQGWNEMEQELRYGWRDDE